MSLNKCKCGATLGGIANQCICGTTGAEARANMAVIGFGGGGGGGGNGNPFNVVRSFETGATRSADSSRYDPEGFLSPIAIERFCEYMQKHRLQADGSIRASDNWQKGLPRDTYIKGLWRHFLHAWTRHRGHQPKDSGAAADIEEDLCAIIFNAQGYLHEILRDKA